MQVAETEYVKYQHVEKVGTDETEGLLDGECHIFPKLDGTNAQVWYDGERLHCGSRRREIQQGDDNAGFAAWAQNSERLLWAMQDLPDFTRVFGEWLVPHTIKGYRDDAWRVFYIFDVIHADGEYLYYDEWGPWADRHGLDIVPPLAIVSYPTIERIQQLAEKNDFFMRPGEIGEGVVVKRYGFKNRYGRTVWGKYVRSSFKEKHAITMGPPSIEGAVPVEFKIAAEHVTAELVSKEAAKINNAEDRQLWSTRSIPRLLSTVFHCVVTESLWDAVKKHKNPTVDFKRLNRAVIERIREVAPELF